MSHIYADPDVYDLVAGSLMMPDEQSQSFQLQQLDPAHITIDAVVQRGDFFIIVVIIIVIDKTMLAKC